jgi:hypothetical protein
MKTTDTPRTEAARFEALRDSAFRWDCIPLKLGQELELEAATYKNEALSLRDSHDLLYRDYQKLEAQNLEIRKALGDEGQRTHKELLDLCRNASSWKTWRQKYRDLDMGVRCEFCDPNGTIWECCKDRGKRTDEEITKLRQEVERLTKLLSLEREGHEGTKKLCAKIIDSTRKTPSMEWHRKNRKVLLK